MTNRQIHDEATPHYGAAKRVGYFVRWMYDTTRVEGQKSNWARWVADVTGTMPLREARKLAKRIAAANGEGFASVRLGRVIDPNGRFGEDECWSEVHGYQLTDDEFWEARPEEPAPAPEPAPALDEGWHPASEADQFNPEAFDHLWNADYTAFRPVRLRWTDDASYARYQGDEAED